MNHIPTLDNHTFTCPACAFRAVLATDGRVMLTQAGDAGHDHIGQARAQVAAIRAEADRACGHLRAQLDQQALTLRQYQHLVYHVVTEHAP